MSLCSAMLALSGCEGPAGEPGARGADGADGADGVDGANGVDGTNGTNGANGADGADGADGVDGVDGTNGTNGTDGVDGTNGTNGTNGWSPLLRLLDESLTTWLPENRTALNAMIQALGATNPSYNPARRPVVAFDWDNTVLKNDIGDATFFWMVANDKVLQPAGRDWSTTSPNLTLDARNALNLACDAAGNPGEPLLTSVNTACADEIVSIYNVGKTVAGINGNAWSPAVTLTMNSAYAWVAQLLAGYKPHEVRDMARAAFDQNNLAALGAPQTVGTSTTLTGYVRVYEEIRDLAETLDQNGFDVWVVTASPQFVVEAISEEIGVPMAHVVGIRNVIVGGRLTADLEGCGSVADGANTMITFYNGKRCWINKVIFGEPVASQEATNPDPAKRPVFVAGDSDTDIAMLKDATYLKLAINRNKTEIMCNAYSNANGKWLVQPMFIFPKGPKSTPYPCSTATDPAGALIVDEDGNPMADQIDSVFALP